MNKSEYTFGTDSAAASRLEKIAEHYNPLAAKTIRRFVEKPVGAAIDLGCGPGFTTHMLADATGCQQVYGIDNSREFLDMAAQRFKQYTFLPHDVTQAPFPTKADVIYTRFLLCHLKAALELVALWMTQLNPNGLLFIDEIDAIDTDLPIFKTYLETAEGIIAAQGGCLYVGKVLGSADFEADVLLNEPYDLPVADHLAASWFFPNTQTIWNENQYVLDHLDPEQRKTIGHELKRLSGIQLSPSNITWRMRALVLRKRQ